MSIYIFASGLTGIRDTHMHTYVPDHYRPVVEHLFPEAVRAKGQLTRTSASALTRRLPEALKSVDGLPKRRAYVSPAAVRENLSFFVDVYGAADQASAGCIAVFFSSGVRRNAPDADAS